MGMQGRFRGVFVAAVLAGGSGCDARKTDSPKTVQPAQPLTAKPASTTAAQGTAPGRTAAQGTVPGGFVPGVLVRAGGHLERSKLETASCDELRASYGIPEATSPKTVDDAALMPFVDSTCDGFRREFLEGGKGTARLTHSVRITEACTFDQTHLVIAASNVRLDCGGSTFDGGGVLNTGLALLKNGGRGRSGTSLPTIRNVRVEHCKFQNFEKFGISINHKFNGKNEQDRQLVDGVLGTEPVAPWDQLHAPSRADSLREQSPSGFYLGNISVSNTGSAAIYLFGHVHHIDIDRLHARDTLLGVYLDHGSRFNTVRNSCFLQQKLEGVKPREFIAVDSSAGNSITSNLFYQNAKGAVWLYKNCSERAETKSTHFFRRQPANENVISHNVIVGGYDGGNNYAGVNIASRQWSPNSSLECGDAAVAGPAGQRYRDYAENNRVVSNVFFPPGLAVSVKDGRNLVENNTFFVSQRDVEKVVRVGQDLDLTYGKRALAGNRVLGNDVWYYDSAQVPTSTPHSFFEFLGESMQHSEVRSNRLQGRSFAAPVSK